MQSADYKIISETWSSIIIKPALPCLIDDKITEDLNGKISKIGKKKNLEKELNEVSMLPDVPNLPYLKISDLKFCNLELNSEHTKIIEKLEEYGISYTDGDVWQIQIPYLGEDFLDVLYGYYMPYNLFPYQDVHENIHVMTVSELKNFFDLLVTSENSIYKTIIFLNGHHIYHHDIKLNNLVYNRSTNKLYLIDFDSSISRINTQKYIEFVYKINYKYFDRIRFCIEVLLKLLYVSIGNKYIYENIIDLVYELEKLDQTLFKLRIETEINVGDAIDSYLSRISERIYSLDENAPIEKYVNQSDRKHLPLTNYTVSKENAAEYTKTSRGEREIAKQMKKEDELSQIFREPQKIRSELKKMEQEDELSKTFRAGKTKRKRKCKKSKCKKSKCKKSKYYTNLFIK